LLKDTKILKNTEIPHVVLCRAFFVSNLLWVAYHGG